MRYSSAWSSTVSGSDEGLICTTAARLVPTSVSPWRSTMSPRGASMGSLRRRFSLAWTT